jgi:hypothetical protein
MDGGRGRRCQTSQLTRGQIVGALAASSKAEFRRNRGDGRQMLLEKMQADLIHRLIPALLGSLT